MNKQMSISSTSSVYVCVITYGNSRGCIHETDLCSKMQNIVFDSNIAQYSFLDLQRYQTSKHKYKQHSGLNKQNILHMLAPFKQHKYSHQKEVT